jgi:hypothetical protein
LPISRAIAGGRSGGAPCISPGEAKREQDAEAMTDAMALMVMSLPRPLISRIKYKTRRELASVLLRFRQWRVPRYFSLR